ncbi:MAG: hypothetical protein IKN45_01970 [Lachnospiraceae bacterium]|nr:hypothetical protein [Lachnospiraceae bacterium]
MAQHNELRKVMQDIVEKLEAMGFALRIDKPKENEWTVRKNSRHSEAGSSLYYFDDEKTPIFRNLHSVWSAAFLQVRTNGLEIL